MTIHPIHGYLCSGRTIFAQDLQRTTGSVNLSLDEWVTTLTGDPVRLDPELQDRAFGLVLDLTSPACQMTSRWLGTALPEVKATSVIRPRATLGISWSCHAPQEWQQTYAVQNWGAFRERFATGIHGYLILSIDIRKSTLVQKESQVLSGSTAVLAGRGA